MRRAVKETGGYNGKNATNIKIIASKLVQRSYAISDIVKVIYSDTDDKNLKPVLIGKVTSVKIKNVNGEERIKWGQVNVPVFRYGEVFVGKLKLVNNIEMAVAGPRFSARQPDFTNQDFFRFLHMLADCRITSPVQQLMHVKSREELDREFSDPWSDLITTLFNDENFQPARMAVPRGGVTSNVIESIDPTKFRHVRDQQQNAHIARTFLVGRAFFPIAPNY